MLNTGSPSLCEFEEFNNLLRKSWDSGVLSNNGPLLQELELKICKALNINQYIAVTNGTIALQLAIKALDIKGTILVPAFSWIASAAAVSWQNCKIRYCDINPKTLNICTNSIENNIDSSVEAIMPVHVFGNPCDVEALNVIAQKYNLKLLYDAAHAFGTTYDGKSILSYGDISCVSTHATKIFNTAEGGGLVSTSKIINEKIKSLRFFGFNENKNLVSEGINAKMSEIHAALGIANLMKFRKTMIHRRLIDNIYRNELYKYTNINFQHINKGSNCSYFPIILSSELNCQKLIEILSNNNVIAKRYFNPSLNKIKIIATNDKCPISESISRRILCLPTHDNISIDDAISITKLISKSSQI
tara:strand:+ start:10023 stop:11102 length:1080 start_codon:yes stop_codon:yes gene_type:complete